VNDSFVVVNQGRAKVDAKAHQQKDLLLFAFGVVRAADSAAMSAEFAGREPSIML
jgi:hypothetical protein